MLIGLLNLAASFRDQEPLVLVLSPISQGTEPGHSRAIQLSIGYKSDASTSNMGYGHNTDSRRASLPNDCMVPGISTWVIG